MTLNWVTYPSLFLTQAFIALMVTNAQMHTQRQEVTHVIAKTRHTTAARAGKYKPGPLRQTLIAKERREGAVVYSSYYRTRCGYALNNIT